MAGLTEEDAGAGPRTQGSDIVETKRNSIGTRKRDFEF